MPILARLLGTGGETANEQCVVIGSKKAYATVGFMAARWARAALRNSNLGEGQDEHMLRLRVEFINGEPEQAVTEETGEERPPKRRRRKKS